MSAFQVKNLNRRLDILANEATKELDKACGNELWRNIGFEAFSYLWLQIKLILVILMSIYHEYLGKCLKSLKSGTNTKSPKFFRIINEIPTVLLILIVFIAIFKPL